MGNEIKNYSTRISHHKTISEIEQILAEHGATGIMKDYKNGNITALYFQITTERGNITFRLPAEVQKVQKIMHDGWKNGGYRSISEKKAKSMDHARNVAWRIIKDWIDSQLALISIGLVDIEQIFLPYAYDMRTDQTLYERIRSGELDGLLAGRSDA